MLIEQQSLFFCRQVEEYLSFYKLYINLFKEILKYNLFLIIVELDPIQIIHCKAACLYRCISSNLRIFFFLLFFYFRSDFIFQTGEINEYSRFDKKNPPILKVVIDCWGILKEFQKKLQKCAWEREESQKTHRKKLQINRKILNIAKFLLKNWETTLNAAKRTSLLPSQIATVM